MNNEGLWQATLAQMQLSVSEANFATWFKGTRILSREDERITVSVPNSFVKEWLENKYQKIILKILRSLNQEVKKVEFLIEKCPLKKENVTRVSKSGQTPFKEFQTDRETGLNVRYAFENFVVGSFNELVHAAAWATAESPGMVYNPLFIYGKVGLGKTHILQAIGNQIIKNISEKKVRYVSSEKFTEGVISAIKNKTIEGFKKEYRLIDILIIDDIQFLAGKEKTQEEFFHIFNDLYQKNKQIVLSSDKPPKSILALTERLRSRFEGGMIADISYPDFETRIAILKNKAQEKQVNFSDEIYNFLAENIRTNIRELEGALNRLVLYQKVEEKSINLEGIKDLFQKTVFSPLQKITPQKIIETVADFYDLKEKELLSISRKKEIVRPRQIAMFLLRTKTNSSFPFIAKIFGGKDHTTAIYSCEKVSQEIEKDEILERDVNLIKTRLSEI